MAALVLIASGTFALGWGLVRGFLMARAAVRPLACDGEPTRRLVEASRPVYARAQVRASIRFAVLAAAWLVVAMYGLYLATVGLEALR